MKHPVRHHPVARDTDALDMPFAAADTRRSVRSQSLDDTRLTIVAPLITEVSASTEGRDDGALEAPERRLCHRLIELLDRQCEYRVATALKALQIELCETLRNPEADISLCQLACALANVAQGNRDEAAQILWALSQSALDDEFIASNVALALSRIGAVRGARSLALTVRERFNQSVDTLHKVMLAFENCLDFAEASTTARRQLELIDNVDARLAIHRKLTLYSEIAVHADYLNVSDEAMLSSVEHAVASLTAMGHHVYRVELRGTWACSVRLEFDIHATPSVCWDETTTLDTAMELIPDGLTVSEIVPFVVHSFAGRIRRPNAMFKE